MNHGDVVTYFRNNVAIAAIVAMSRDVFTPPTQAGDVDHQGRFQPEAGEKTEEHLTLVYLDPSTASPLLSGGQLQDSTRIAYDIKPLQEKDTNGWKPYDSEAKSKIVSGVGPAGIQVPGNPATVHAEIKAENEPLDDIQKGNLAQGHTVHVARYADGQTIVGLPPLPEHSTEGNAKIDEYEHPQSVKAKGLRDAAKEFPEADVAQNDPAIRETLESVNGIPSNGATVTRQDVTAEESAKEDFQPGNILSQTGAATPQPPIVSAQGDPKVKAEKKDELDAGVKIEDAR